MCATPNHSNNLLKIASYLKFIVKIFDPSDINRLVSSVGNTSDCEIGGRSGRVSESHWGNYFKISDIFFIDWT